MVEEAWKGPPPRPSFLEAIGDGIEAILTWRVGIGFLIVVWLYVEATTPVFRQTVHGSNKVKVVRAKQDIQHIERQVLQFSTEQRRLPKRMAELVDRPTDAKDWPEGGYLERLPMDPWGADYYLLVLAADDSTIFDVISLGADNEPGGEDFEADLHCRKEPR